MLTYEKEMNFLIQMKISVNKIAYIFESREGKDKLVRCLPVEHNMR